MAKPNVLPAEFTIYALSGLRKEWLASLPKPARSKRGAAQPPAPWALDGAAVAEIDAAAVQLLVSLSQALGARHRKLVLTQPSERLANACEALGLGALLGRDGEQGVAA